MTETQILVSYLIFLASMLSLCVFYVKHQYKKEEREYQKFLARQRISALESTLARWEKYVPIKERF